MAVTRRSRKLGMALLAVLVSATAIAVALTVTSSPSLNFSVAGVYYGGVLANPGDVADFSVVLASSSSKSITLWFVIGASAGFRDTEAGTCRLTGAQSEPPRRYDRMASAHEHW